MIKSKHRTDDTLLAEVVHDVAELKTTVQLIQQKQSLQTQRHDGIKESLHKHREAIQAGLVKMEERLHKLENFMLSSLQRLSFIKTLFRWWPVLIVTLLVCFAIGIFVDDQKVAAEIKDKIELKIP